ncbi:hypothetical protein Nepgr_016738 [Nepenthes gracilis]|uniref:Uncharacterized protein n=1 Tax=Nepenthes gracilis TaxID=150966 RepID=A0AAD3SR03_NEPGR|nr:hypothetical protein Nepgr_016738 [Nepenthes gracilis]
MHGEGECSRKKWRRSCEKMHSGGDGPRKHRWFWKTQKRMPTENTELRRLDLERRPIDEQHEVTPARLWNDDQ